MSTRICLLVLVLLTVCILPRPAYAHSLDNPQATMLLEQYRSGVYTLDAAQLVTPEQTHLDVRVAVDGGVLPGDVRMVAIANTQDGRSHVERMEREDDVFGASLPVGTDWAVSLLIDGDVGESTADVTVTGYRESPLVIRFLTFVAPAVLMGGILFTFKRSGITLSVDG